MTVRYLPETESVTGTVETRFIGDLMGSYLLASRSKSLSTVQIFACRARSVSTHVAVVDAPVLGHVGETLTATFDTLGILHGRIERLLDGGFAMSLELSDSERKGLASRIVWLKRRATRQVDDRRQHKRVLPRRPRATLNLGDGRQLECLIIDMSASGVAVSADAAPPIGFPVHVGKLAGRVVRHLPHGFAIQFAAVQPLQEVESLLTAKAA